MQNGSTSKSSSSSSSHLDDNCIFRWILHLCIVYILRYVIGQTDKWLEHLCLCAHCVRFVDSWSSNGVHKRTVRFNRTYFYSPSNAYLKLVSRKCSEFVANWIQIRLSNEHFGCYHRTLYQTEKRAKNKTNLWNILPIHSSY